MPKIGLYICFNYIYYGIKERQMSVKFRTSHQALELECFGYFFDAAKLRRSYVCE
jgi:hypothetical protein